MNELYTVTQVDWRHYDYIVTVHKSYHEAWIQLVEIYNDRKADGNPADEIAEHLISGDGWEAKLSKHTWTTEVTE